MKFLIRYKKVRVSSMSVHLKEFFSVNAPKFYHLKKHMITF